MHSAQCTPQARSILGQQERNKQASSIDEMSPLRCMGNPLQTFLSICGVIYLIKVWGPQILFWPPIWCLQHSASVSWMAWWPLWWFLLIIPLTKGQTTNKLILELWRWCIFVEKEIFLWLRLSVGPMFYGSFTALRGSLEPSDKKDTQDTGNTKHWDTLHSGTRKIYEKDAICWSCHVGKRVLRWTNHILISVEWMISPNFEWKYFKSRWPVLKWLVVARKVQLIIIKKCCRLNLSIRWS